MPASVQRHNLARLRDELNLTQATLGDWVGRSAATIKAVEIGKLALSPRLAALIAAVTGADKDWLLRNDLSDPMPPLMRSSSKLDPEQEAYARLCDLLLNLFERLFASLMRLKKSQRRTAIETNLEIRFKQLKDNDSQPAEEPVGVEALEFFKAHPEFLDPDLANLINLDFLIKDALRIQDTIKTDDRKVVAEGRQAEKWPNEHFSEPSPEGQRAVLNLIPPPRKSADFPVEAVDYFP